MATPVYNYDFQCWILDGIIQDCNHPQEGELTMLGDVFDGCNCYGRAHAGELFDPEMLTPTQMQAMAAWSGKA